MQRLTTLVITCDIMLDKCDITVTFRLRDFAIVST